ncbi:hypothetical protein PGB90_008699 [Kerria lacca]
MADSESEDSDAEGGLGNVNRVVMRPPGHSGKAKKGHLCFDASFETGNLGKVDLINDFEYDLYIRPDTCNPHHRMWFNFIVDNTKLDQRVMFNIVNVSKHRNLFRDGMTPIVKSSSKKKWCRMPSHQVYFYKSPYHNNHYVLTLPFCFDKEEEAYQFAYSYPYSYSKCQAYLENIERKYLPFFRRELLGNSLEKRRIDMVTITSPTNMSINKKLRVIVILCRAHPGDSPTSFICQGIIDFLISNHPIVEHLRSQVVFKIIPMVNPDGVVLGNFRSNLLGADFDRNWNKISQWIHPALYAVFNAISKLNKDKNVELDIVIDLHAHCSLQGVFVYGNTYQDVYRHERHTLFPKLLSHNIDGYEPTYCMFNRDNRKKGSCRRFFSNLKDTINCYSIYASFHDHRIGRNIVRTFSDYYNYVGILTVCPQKRKKKIISQTPTKRHRKKLFWKIRKRTFKKHRHKRKINIVKKVIAKELKSKSDLKKGYIDFSDITFPAVERKTIKRNLLTTRRKSTRILPLKQKECETDSLLKILKIY